MAGLPELHRQGIGRALLGHAEGILPADGVELLQAKALAPASPTLGTTRGELSTSLTACDHYKGSKTCGTLRTRPY